MRTWTRQRVATSAAFVTCLGVWWHVYPFSLVLCVLSALLVAVGGLYVIHRTGDRDAIHATGYHFLQRHCMTLPYKIGTVVLAFDHCQNVYRRIARRDDRSAR